MFRLDHKNVLITGAGSGIGKAIAELFARVGASVWVVDRDAEGGEATVNSIAATGGTAKFAA
ncbi:MAG: SDR family NAD(P)-dependent oxidoreductase, partial [Proteobacteria bacterium]|nr:SDR family NAD(P)-dependent oxidoreductase [Pseudomonadota bacterium]